MPVLRDGDSFLLILLTSDFEALLSRILQDHLNMLRVDCIQNIKEELTADLSTFGELVWQVTH